jgi:hypothetical protein
VKKETRSKNGFKEEHATQRGDDPEIQQAIAKKAYELYEKRGQQHGHDLEDWLEAEQWVLSAGNAGEPLRESLGRAPRVKTTRLVRS